MQVVLAVSLLDHLHAAVDQAHLALQPPSTCGRIPGVLQRHPPSASGIVDEDAAVAVGSLSVLGHDLHQTVGVVVGVVRPSAVHAVAREQIISSRLLQQPACFARLKHTQQDIEGTYYH